MGNNKFKNFKFSLNFVFQCVGYLILIAYVIIMSFGKLMFSPMNPFWRSMNFFEKYAAVIALLFFVLKTFGVDTTAILTGIGILGLIVGLGGLIMRLKHCKETINEYLDGKIERIEELEQPVLPLNENHEKGTLISFNDHIQNITANFAHWKASYDF